MHKIIEAGFLTKCTGCGACQNVCPQNAIKLKEGRHTFLYPEIDETICVDCNLCNQVCPVNNYKTQSADPIIYASRAGDEIRARSSSGGMYSVFAENYISQGGIVYATALTKDLKVRFLRLTTAEDIAVCRGSKYVQSEVGFTYRGVKEDLEKKLPVLFFGCPCHIAGLKNFLRKKYDNLLTVDLICHGVPSQKLFSSYLEDKSSDVITDVLFRDKTLGWRADAIKIKYKTEADYIRSLKTEDEFETGFQKCITLRDSCEHCKFCTFPRVADITIGDFWGCQNFISDDGKGTSLVLVNNERGMSFYKAVEPSLIFSQKLDCTIGELKKYNRLFEYYPHSKQKELFFAHLENKSFSQSVKYADNNFYDVGIVGIPTVENFGGSLTYVGLYYTLREMGKTCFFVERPKFSKHPPAKLSKSYYSTPFEPFTVIYDEIPDKNRLRALNDRTSCFVVGSDQMFHHNLYNNFSRYVTLDWVSDNKKKIAFAASFGHDTFTGDELERAEMAYFMKKFDAFSVRESSGVQLAKQVFDVDAVQVLDPVFLCAPEIYKNLAARAQFAKKKGYISAYMLDPNSAKARILATAGKKLSKPYYVFSEMFYDNKSVKAKWSLDIEIGKIEDRLASILNSDLLITDSFHGVCFAIIFRKNFIAIRNKGRGVARFESILNLCGLTDRLISDTDDIADMPALFENIDYDEVYKKLEPEISRSKKWLEDSLKPKQKAFSDYDILSKQMRDINAGNQNKFNKILRYLGLSYISEYNIFEYINDLVEQKENLVIAVAAKDTPGMSFTLELCAQLKKLGLSADFMNAHWCGYIALIYKGVTIKEECKYEEKLTYEFSEGNLTVSINSAPLHKGNVASIVFNGKEYSVNMRGLNFVVYDVIQKYVTDAVNFDTHTPRFIATRK